MMKTLTVEMIESLCGPASPRPWSIIAGESGEGVIGDADGLDITAASMADCTIIVRAVNDVDSLRSDLARVTAERDHLAEREALFIKALSPVCDAGQYRADVVSAIGRVVSERDALRAEVARLTTERKEILAEVDRRSAQRDDAINQFYAVAKAAHEIEAEVEAMAALLREAHDTCPTYFMPSELDVRILDALDALRARKVGG